MDDAWPDRGVVRNQPLFGVAGAARGGLVLGLVTDGQDVQAHLPRAFRVLAAFLAIRDRCSCVAPAFAILAAFALL